MAKQKAAPLKVMMKPSVVGLTPQLCDASGTPLPGQARVDIRTGVDDIARVTVEFVMVEFAHADAEPPASAEG